MPMHAEGRRAPGPVTRAPSGAAARGLRGEEAQPGPAAAQGPRAGSAGQGGPSGGGSGDDDARRRLLLSFAAFDASHHRLWLHYAHTQVGSRPAAHGIVEAACRHLSEHWEHALQQESLAEYAWTVLKDHVERWLGERGRRSRLADTAAFHGAVRDGLLRELRDEFAVLEGELCLPAAVERLPERQYDVIVLRYGLGCTEEEVADCLGLDPAAVRSHLGAAKRRLTRQLRTAPGPKP
jgi:RNA polymerase sigma factor (sigma-70 family)